MKKERLLNIVDDLRKEIVDSEAEEFYVDLSNKQEYNTITWGVIHNRNKKVS